MNLLRETVEMLLGNGKNGNNVLFVTNGKTRISWKRFCKIVKNVNYNDSYGYAEIDISLKVVGKDFWLERHEYDGSEWWEYKESPNKKEFPICSGKFDFFDD